MLRGIDDMRACGLGQDQLDKQLWALVESKIPMRSRRTPGWKDDLRKDTASHFILRLAYCRTEELRLWFLEQEAYLLRARLERLNEDGLAAFIRREQLVFDMVSEEEKAAKASVLQTSVRGPLLSTMEFERTAFYKVRPFTEALELVARRHVHLEDGLAYVPAPKLVVIIAGQFRDMQCRPVGRPARRSYRLPHFVYGNDENDVRRRAGCSRWCACT